MRGHVRTPVVPSECPKELVTIIEKCMSRDPDERPSASEVYFMLLACPPKLQDQEDLLTTPSDYSVR